MKTGDCLICDRIALIKKGKNFLFVKELKSGYIVIGDTQYAKGYTLLLSKHHKAELHELSQREKIQFLNDMTITAKAVWGAFQPDKLNYELLGNTDEHLHWHIIPRYKHEEYRNSAYWSIPKRIRNSKKYALDESRIQELKKQLLAHL